MKTVVRGSEVPHLWFHQTQSSARSSNGTLFFADSTIFSYGDHFPIAKIFDGKAGKAVLFTSQSYSSTTAKHKSYTRRAIPSGVTIFEVPNVRPYPADHADNLAHLVSEVTRLLSEAGRARSAFNREWVVNNAIPKAIEAATSYAKYFKLRAPKLPKLPDNWEAYGQQLRKAAAKEAAAKRESNRIAKESRLVAMRQTISEWQTGKHVSLPWDAPTMLRVESGEVVTSKGARFPVEHAKLALRVIEGLKQRNELPFQRNGHAIHLGHYEIDRIDIDGTIHAGCHVVEWAEVQRIAPAIKAS